MEALPASFGAEFAFIVVISVIKILTKLLQKGNFSKRRSGIMARRQVLGMLAGLIRRPTLAGHEVAASNVLLRHNAQSLARIEDNDVSISQALNIVHNLDCDLGFRM